MDPNEAMDQEPVDTFETQTEPQAEPVSQPTQPGAGAYHGAGVGQKESPYSSSPYYSAQETQSDSYTGPAWNQNQQSQNTNQYQNPNQNQYQYQPPYQSEPPKRKKKERKPMGKGAKRAIAAALAVVLVGGSCGVTAAVVNNRWENKMDALEADVQVQILDLKEKLENVSSVSAGTSVSGSPVASEGGLTPSQVYAANVNSVVAITNTYTYTSSGGWYGQSTTSEAVATGSGFIISQDGYLVTNYHVVESAETLTVTTYSGDEYDATLVGYDKINDVALLKVEATGLDAVTIGSSDDLVVGDQVVAIGNPLGELTATMTVGYVSGKDRSVSTDGTIINMLQTDAAINSGNSGGPLFNMKGEVVGITTAKYSGSSSSGATIEGIGFAIPIDDVMSMVEDLRNYGYVKDQAYLGVTVRNLDSSTAAMYSLPSGSYVDSVVEGGSADRAGVQPKDIITAIGEYEVSGNSELTTALRKFKAGDTSTITVYRSGQELTLEITFDEKPQDLTTESTDPTVSGEMPENGSYEEWYKYFFGNGQG